MNGNELWNYTTSAPIYSAADITNGMVYVTPTDGSLYALNATNGNKIWNYSIPTTFIQISPIVVNNVVYLGSGKGAVYAFDATNGSKLWSYAVSSTTLSSPAIADGVLYVGSADGNVYALRVSPATSPSVKPSTTLPLIIGVIAAVLIVATAILLMLQKRLKTKTKNPPATPQNSAFLFKFGGRNEIEANFFYIPHKEQIKRRTILFFQHNHT